jgi:protein involved in polysaccharide export with SLBB domain
VNLPNVYTINEGMTLDELITIAGGFKQEAYLHECEIIRYSVVNFEREKEIITLNLRDSKEFIIKAFDEITIRKIPKWSEKKHIRLTGEVKFPGSYTIEEGDRLVDVIKRAGGYTKQAFLKGAVFTRESIRTLQQNKLNESLLKLKKRALATGSSNFGQESGMDPLKVAELVDSLARQAESLKPIGRISITLMNDLDSFQNSRSNLTLKESDTLHIPSFNDTILVIGEVMSPSSLIFDSSNTEEYLKRVGGLTEMADDDYIYIVHANGEAERYKSGWFTSNIDIKQGDAIIVPQEIITFTGMQIAKDVSMILYQFAITMASLSTIGVL